MRKSSSLSEKVAIITGGASGIGAALCHELARRGCEVVVADRQEGVAEEVARAIRDRGGKATAHALDVRDLREFQALVQATVVRAHRVDYLFNNAGIAVGREMAAYDASDFDDVFDVNLRGVAYGIQAVYPTMIAQRSGHIINTASVAGLVSCGGAGSYVATKHAVVGLSKSLRIEAQSHGVRVSVLCPGAIRTPILTGGRFGRIEIEGATESSVLRQWERVRPMAPEAFAKRALDRVIANDPIIVVPSFWKALWYLDRISPSLALRFGSRIFDHVRTELAASHGSTSEARPVAKTNGHATTSRT
jgi:NADP-dependent 3-hydroxy acid dehydrogenase YdfG